MTVLAPPRSVLSIDFETCSTADLRRTGAVKYALDPTTRVLCMAWAFDNEPVRLWNPDDQTTPFPQRVIDHVAAGGIVRGWNVRFELAVWNYCLHPKFLFTLPMLSIDQLRDTMAQAAYWGLPMKLEDAGPAAGLGIVKDTAGHKLMLQMCRPRGIDPFGKPIFWHETDPTKLERLGDYCKQDVEVERALADALPPLPAREQNIWEIDARINARGVRVDLPLVSRMQRVVANATAHLNKTFSDLTGGYVKKTTDAKRLLDFLRAAGYPHDNLKKDTVKARLADPACEGLERELLMLRREAAKASTAKLNAFENAAVHSRVYGMLQHYGATRTGRWAGRLVQLQNLPRGSIKNVAGAVKLILSSNGQAPIEDMEALFGDGALGIVASCLRACLVPSPGHLLLSCDLSQIEARVVAWLAGQDDILKVFASGQDVYVYTAAAIGSTDRQLGKVCVLGLGFGMGPNKFIETAKTYGITLGAAQAEDIVKSWRAANSRIAQFWWDCDAAARDIIGGKFKTVRVGRVVFGRRGNAMSIRLPSGRELVYRGVRLDYDPQTGRDTITYRGVNQYTKKWGDVRTYGGKLVENIVQATARDVMADAMVELEGEGLELLLSIHDEAIAEAPAGVAREHYQKMQRAMSRAPTWAPGLPVAAEGWVGDRYKKG